MQKDLNYLEKYDDEIKEFLKEKYIFLNEGNVSTINSGWINISKGINLCSDEFGEAHYHVHFYGKNNNDNLFNIMGKRFKCSCYLIDNDKIIKRCNQYFTFNNKVKFTDCTYYIDGIKKICEKGNFVKYNLEREKVKYNSKKSKGFYFA